MAIEIEAKVRVTDRAAVAGRLREAVGEPVADVVTRDAFFDTADDRLLAADSGLRLRVVVGAAERRCVLTWKGPRAAGDVKQREEIELGVDDPDRAEAMLEQLGYRRRLSFEKWRQSWALGDCRVELDRVPHLGDFLEIEGPSEEAVLDARRRLGLGEAPLIREGYARLVSAYLADEGLSDQVIRFNQE